MPSLTVVIPCYNERTAVRRIVDAMLDCGIAPPDADLEYDPHEFSTLIEPLAQSRADMVFGSRFMGGRPHRVLYFWRGQPFPHAPLQHVHEPQPP